MRFVNQITDIVDRQTLHTAIENASLRHAITNCRLSEAELKILIECGKLIRKWLDKGIDIEDVEYHHERDNEMNYTR